MRDLPRSPQEGPSRCEEMKLIAVNGRGDIGKSTLAANLSAALGLVGRLMLQVAFDSKQDSTRLPLGGETIAMILDYLRLPPRRGGNGDSCGARGESCLLAFKCSTHDFNTLKISGHPFFKNKDSYVAKLAAQKRKRQSHLLTLPHAL
jgi:hypothetical protein